MISTRSTLLLLALIAIAYCESIKLNVGQFKALHLKESTYQDFEVFIRGKHRGVYLQASPYGCDSPVETYASSNPSPTEEDHQWRSEKEVISRPTLLAIDEKEHGDAPLYISIKQAKGANCLVHVVAHIRHFQNLLQLAQGVPAYGMLPKSTEELQFVEFKMNKYETDVALDLAFLVTNLNRGSESSTVLQAYASTTNSRPTQPRHTWGGINNENGDSVINISHQDERFVPGTYWVGIQSKNLQQDALYSIVAHTIFRNGSDIVDTPVLLQESYPQTGLSLPSRYTHYTLYVRKSAKVTLSKLSGNVKLFASSKAGPTKDKHEYEGRDASETSVELDIELEEESKFIYIGVLGLD